MRKNFTPEQMLHTVRQAESGTPVAEVCRKLGITEQNLLQVEAAGGGHGDRGADSAAAVGRREQKVESAGG
jgi:transposase-like protein